LFLQLYHSPLFLCCKLAPTFIERETPPKHKNQIKNKNPIINLIYVNL
jgi:hypothetical protein